jgi:hypothetical protein
MIAQRLSRCGASGATAMNKEIDLIVKGFIPEMARISNLDQSEEQKERQAKAWLRAALEKFAKDIKEADCTIASSR